MRSPPMWRNRKPRRPEPAALVSSRWWSVPPAKLPFAPGDWRQPKRERSRLRWRNVRSFCALPNDAGAGSFSPEIDARDLAVVTARRWRNGFQSANEPMPGLAGIDDVVHLQERGA